MATLTSDYQYLGRSTVIKSLSGSLNYYILVYGKTSADFTTGKHTVTIKEVLASTNDNATFYAYATQYMCFIDGETVFRGDNKPSKAWELGKFTAGGVTYKTGTVIGEGSIAIDGSDDMTKNITITCYWNFLDTPDSYTPERKGNDVEVTATLPAIPRRTWPTFSAAPYTMGTALTINLAPANNTFKHKIGYDFGGLKGQTSGLSIGTGFTAQGKTSVTFTPPTTLGNQISNASSGTCIIHCYTYTSNGTHIGTSSSSITINVPSYTPEINNVTLTGNNLLNGIYVQGKSTVTVNAGVKTYYGAGIKSIVVETDTKKYTTLPCTSAALSSGNRAVKITFTDTRNKSVTYTSSAFTVYPYSAPNISAFSLERQADGTTVIASMSGSISPLNNKNTKSFSITLNGVTNYLTVSGYEINGSTTFTNVPTDNTLTATAKIADYYTEIKKNATLPTVAVTMDFHHSGTGVAFGKVAEHSGYLDVNWNAQFRKYLVAISTMFAPLIVKRDANDKEAAIRFENSNGVLGYIGMMGDINGGLRRWTSNSGTSYLVLDAGNTKDFIVEQGTNDLWTYEKWNSGKVVCWGNVSTTPTTVNGNNAVTVNLPFTFVGTDYKVNITPAKAAMYIDAFGDCATNGNITHTTTNFTMAYKYSYGTAYAVSFNVVVYGKWK